MTLIEPDCCGAVAPTENVLFLGDGPAAVCGGARLAPVMPVVQLRTGQATCTPPEEQFASTVAFVPRRNTALWFWSPHEIDIGPTPTVSIAMSEGTLHDGAEPVQSGDVACEFTASASW